VLILAGTGWYLSQHWNQIPAIFPVHWGVDLQPNRWAHRTFKGVYGILFIGGSILLLLYGVGLNLLFGTRRGPGDTRLIRAFCTALFVIMTSLAASMAAVAIHPLMGETNRFPAAFPVALLMPLLVIGLAMIPVIRATRQMPEREDSTPDECWRMGNFYYNPDDPALMVRNRVGYGYSANFGRPFNKFVFPLLIVQVFVVVIYVVS
jgi:uncharacterized membrane protein